MSALLAITGFFPYTQDFEALFGCNNGRADRIDVTQLADDVIIARHYERDCILDLRIEYFGALKLQFSETLFGRYHPFAIVQKHSHGKVCLGVVTGGGVTIDLDTGVQLLVSPA